VPIGDIAPEIEKVALNLGDRKVVTPEATRVVARKAHEEVIWEITHRMTVRDLPGALRALDGALLFKENAPVRILFGLAAAFRQITLVRDLMNANVKGRELQTAAGVWRERWDGVRRGAEARTGADVRRGMVALAQAERVLKSQANDPRVVLELTLGEIC
jgi:DNA polymerase III delta subunit